ncbi:pentapeptide repeat-containing protein [Verrucomicrobiales bacterium]|nr:pentapeptide repeat-containing protein [Verrucomicrobiales bacterium]
MKKPIIFSVLFFIISSISSFGQEEGRWIEETIDPETGLRTGKIEVDGRIHRIEPFADIRSSFLVGVDLSRANLRFADLRSSNFAGANLKGADLRDSDLRSADILRALSLPSTAGADTRGTADRSYVSDMDLDFYNLGEIRKLKLLKPELLSNDQEQRDSITANTTKIDSLTSDVTTQLETLGNNDTAIGEQLTALGQNDISIGEQMTTLGENDQSIMAEINAMKAQLQTLVASVAEKDAQIAEKDAKIAELEQGGGGQSLEQVLEQVRDARAGSVVLTVDPEGDNITLGLTIEQSDNLTEWTKLDGEMTRTIPIPDGKKFYRFALDK